MPNEQLKQALREAYATPPTGAVILDTIEVLHDDFDPIRLVNNYADIMATLENGDIVSFTSHSFTLGLPGDNETPSPRLSVKIENTTRELVLAIDSVVNSTTPIRLIYRPYLSTDLTTPQYDPPLSMELSNITATTSSVSAQARFGELANTKFPKETYTVEKFPQLLWR